MGPALPDEHPIILFDGVCNLCNRWVQFVIERDPEAEFRFAPLQSEVGEALVAEEGLPTDELESVVLIENGEVYTKSDAVLRVGKRLGGVYGLLWPFRVLPTRFRNVWYDLVAANRYDWFGKRDQCMMPTPDIESRFLAGGPGPDGDESQSADS